MCVYVRVYVHIYVSVGTYVGLCLRERRAYKYLNVLMLVYAFLIICV